MPCGPCMKRDTSSPLSLKLRTYACTVGDDLFRRRFRRVVGHSPAFNGSFLVQETCRMNRIGGMDQHGDVVVRHDYLKEGWTVRVEYRAGDEGLVEALERELARELTPCPNLPSPIKSRPPGMAYFFEMVQGQPLGRKVLIADSAIESAHSTVFAAYRETRLELELLTRLHTLRHTPCGKARMSRSATAGRRSGTIMRRSACSRAGRSACRTGSRPAVPRTGTCWSCTSRCCRAGSRWWVGWRRWRFRE